MQTKYALDTTSYESRLEWNCTAKRTYTYTLFWQNIPSREFIKILYLTESDCTTISDTATLTLENLFNIPWDPITEVHINLEHLQILGKSLKELNNLADRIAEHKRTTIWMERFMCYLHIAGYIAWFWSVYISL